MDQIAYTVHIGNFRTFIFRDYMLDHVMNVGSSGQEYRLTIHAWLIFFEIFYMPPCDWRAGLAFCKWWRHKLVAKGC